MKRTVVLMRHAKSSWEFAGLRDYERPLAPRGEKAAPMMAERLKSMGFMPDLIISSPARRAIMTAQRVAEGIGYDLEGIIEAESLYIADVEDYLQILRALPKGCERVMLFGHNPEIAEAVEYLCGEYFEKFPTAAYAMIEFEGSWKSVQKGKFLKFDYPKSVKKA